jgi:spheroidene monooxygenase
MWSPPAVTQVVSISFYRFSSRSARLWALTMMAGARLAMRQVPDIGFWKLCGSGGGVGFTPRINIDVFAILATWPDEATARDRTQNASIFNRYATKASETWTVYLKTDSVRGKWAGQSPFVASNTGQSGPIGVLTRATIKPSILRQFWSRVPDVSERIGNDPNVLFKIGIGESPLFQQITFSLWPNAAAIANFARTGHHAEAIKSVRTEQWFREELYARFTLLSDHGSWADAPYLKQR